MYALKKVKYIFFQKRDSILHKAFQFRVDD